MANGHGGYRKPTNPAPVSGPGAHSARTDGKQPVMSMPDAAYGEDATFRAAQQAGPMAQVLQTGGTGAPAAAGAPLTPMGAPSTQPGTPVTAGADAGPGPGSATLGLPMDLQSLSRQDAADLKRYLPLLIDIANKETTPQGTKNFVRQLIANL